MKTKIVFLAICVLALTTNAFSQIVQTDESDAAKQRKIAKQVLVSDIENRVRELSLAAPRVMARYKVAQWLWTDGNNDIGRAEEFAVSAVEDLYKNRDQIPATYSTNLSAELFTLLDRHAPRTSKNLKEKYKVQTTENPASPNSDLNQPGGEKAAVDAAIRTLYADSSLDIELPVLLHLLQRRNSPELFRLLDAIIASEERVRGRLSLTTLSFVTPFFSGVSVPATSYQRYARIILDRSREASQLPFGEFDAWLGLVNANMSLVTEKAPQFTEEFGIVRAVLLSRISRKSREDLERNERINNSIDKLGTLIEEAEKTDDPSIKYSLYRRAAKLALDQQLFKESVDLTMKLSTVELSAALIPLEIQKNEAGQMLDTVTQKALANESPDAAIYAINHQADHVRKAEGFTNVAKYFVDKGNLDVARMVVQNALRAAANIEQVSRQASVYFSLIPVSHSIDPTSVFEIHSLAAGSINKIPSLNVEDKPGTDKFSEHVTQLMIVNWNLIPMLSQYVKVNKNGANDLSGRIDKKEIKVFADLVLGIASLNDLPNATAETEQPTQ